MSRGPRVARRRFVTSLSKSCHRIGLAGCERLVFAGDLGILQMIANRDHFDELARDLGLLVALNCLVLATLFQLGRLRPAQASSRVFMLRRAPFFIMNWVFW